MNNPINMFIKNIVYDRWVQAFVLITVIKIVLMGMFSSDFQNELFMPFVKYFVHNGGNPWQYHFENPTGAEFPYSSFMLYLFSLAYLPIKLFDIQSLFWSSLLFKMPILLADLGVVWLLKRLAFSKKDIFIYYFTAPIILYASYMHSQLDLIPTALLFFAVFLLVRGRIRLCSLVMGVALATKFHVIVALPLMLIYSYKRFSWKDVLTLAVVPWIVFGWIIWPYFSEGYLKLVLNNPQQGLIYDAFINIGDGKLYLAFVALILCFARFGLFRRINADLLYTFLSLVFAALVAFLIPAPGWYVWLFPFISIFFIKAYKWNNQIFKLYIVLNCVYLFCVFLFYLPEHHDLLFFGNPVEWKITDPKMRNLSATLLTSILWACMYAFYKFGIKSNFAYKQTGSTIIGIAGDSAAGKTTLLNDIRSLLGEKILDLEGDADHKWERGDSKWEEFTHLNPKANHLYRQYEDLVTLKRGKNIYRTDYDHMTGKFTERQKIRTQDYISLSGLHAFYLPKMRKIIDLKVFVDTDVRLRNYWKIVRDVKERGHDLDEVMKKIQEREEDALKYITPQKNFADVVVQYFVDTHEELSDKLVEHNLKLRMRLDSGIHLDDILEQLKAYFTIEWDYDQDLKTQYVEFHGDASADVFRRLARKFVFNVEDLVGENPIWYGGFRGLVQLVLLMTLSDKMRGDVGKESYEV